MKPEATSLLLASDIATDDSSKIAVWCALLLRLCPILTGEDKSEHLSAQWDSTNTNWINNQVSSTYTTLDAYVGNRVEAALAHLPNLSDAAAELMLECSGDVDSLARHYTTERQAMEQRPRDEQEQADQAATSAEPVNWWDGQYHLFADNVFYAWNSDAGEFWRKDQYEAASADDTSFEADLTSVSAEFDKLCEQVLTDVPGAAELPTPELDALIRDELRHQVGQA